MIKKLTLLFPIVITLIFFFNNDSFSQDRWWKEKKYKNVYLGTESVREFYFVNELVHIVGADKVIFGSDYNLGLPLTYIPIVEALNIPSSDKELIFSGNILRLIEN